MDALQSVEGLRRHRRGQTYDPRLQQRGPIARHQVFAKFRHMKKAAHVRAVTPDGERHPPLFQARTEVLCPVDRIDDGDPALE